MKQDDPLEDFSPREIAFDGVARWVYVAGRGPAVIVMSEMPGISPEVVRFARWVRGPDRLRCPDSEVRPIDRKSTRLNSSH